MELDAIVAALDALPVPVDSGELFALEQRVRAGAPDIADLLVAQRAAIAADGARALLQRLGQPAGETWLEALMPEPIIGQPLWGHAGPIQWMRVEGELLVTRGAEDGRLRRFDAAGVCSEDREATASDDARCLGELRVSLEGRRVELRESASKRSRGAFEIEQGDGYRWVDDAQLLDSGFIALKIGEDYPGSLYGPEFSWVRLDPRDRSRTKMSAPSGEQRFAGCVAVPLRDGSVRLVEDPKQLEPTRLHAWPLSALALGPGRLISGSDGGIYIHDRDGKPLARGRGRQHNMTEIMVGSPIITVSSYSHGNAHARPHLQVWDAERAEPGLRVDAGERYADFMSCDPTGTRVAYTLDGVLHLRELSEPEASAQAVPLTWHWKRRWAWSADGQRFAIQHSGRAPTVWSLAQGVRERILTTDVLDSAHFGISEDGAVVTTDHSFYCLRALRVDDGEALPSLEPGLNLRCSASRGTKGVAGGVAGGYWFDLASNARTCHKQGSWIYACAVGGSLAVLAGSDGVYAVELDSGELLWRWACEGSSQLHVAVLGDAVVCLDREGQLTTLVEGEVELQRPTNPPGVTGETSMCALPDHSVLVGSPDGWLRRWDPFTGDLIDDYEIGGTRIDALSAGGGKVVCRRWMERSRGEWLGFELDSWAPLRLPPGAERPRLTPDGERLISLDLVARLDLLDARSGALLEQLPFGSWPHAEALEFDGVQVQACAEPSVSDGVHSVEARADGTLDVTRAGELVARWVSSREWCCVAIDGDRVAAGDKHGNIALWALREGVS